MANEIKNCFIVNAPAGSGKTTYIKTFVNSCISENPYDNVLCITYTNRAADELNKDVNSSRVTIGTIHSFLASYLQPYFKAPAVLSCYCSVFESRIRNRIANVEEKPSVSESNNKYVEKYSALNFEIVCSNIVEISYNESPFSALYYGKLSHDDLILFASVLFRTFPLLSQRLSAKYQYVFIDEYQDTTADVLRIFYDSIKGTNAKLYLFGDRMQQIYKNYDGSFEEQFSEFDTGHILRVNYRSTSEIIGILNKIYNDKRYEQIPSEEHPVKGCDYPPRIIITSNTQTELPCVQSEATDTLTLFLLNKERFLSIGASNLFDAYSKMERYGYSSQYTPVDILTSIGDENPDPMMRLLYIILAMKQDFEVEKYGAIIQTGKRNQGIFDQRTWRITTHAEKVALGQKLTHLFNAISVGTVISSILVLLKDSALVNPDYIEKLVGDPEYQNVCTVHTNEVCLLFNYLLAPSVSTQHGVKGESHDSVVFLAEDYNNNPLVHMYHFLDVWSQINISLDLFQQFYYQYSAMLKETELQIGKTYNKIKAADLKQHNDVLRNAAQRIYDHFSGNEYFETICGEAYQAFLSKQTVKNMQVAFDEKCVYGILSAYRLFYVGCSRARRNLTILLDRNRMQGNIELQIKKFKEIGFNVDVKG